MILETKTNINLIKLANRILKLLTSMNIVMEAKLPTTMEDSLHPTQNAKKEKQHGELQNKCKCRMVSGLPGNGQCLAQASPEIIFASVERCFYHFVINRKISRSLSPSNRARHG